MDFIKKALLIVTGAMLSIGLFSSELVAKKPVEEESWFRFGSKGATGPVQLSPDPIAQDKTARQALEYKYDTDPGLKGGAWVPHLNIQEVYSKRRLRDPVTDEPLTKSSVKSSSYYYPETDENWDPTDVAKSPFKEYFSKVPQKQAMPGDDKLEQINNAKFAIEVQALEKVAADLDNTQKNIDESILSTQDAIGDTYKILADCWHKGINDDTCMAAPSIVDDLQKDLRKIRKITKPVQQEVDIARQKLGKRRSQILEERENLKWQKLWSAHEQRAAKHELRAVEQRDTEQSK